MKTKCYASLFNKMLFIEQLKMTFASVAKVAKPAFVSPDLLPENCVEEKTKSFDPNAVMAEIRHEDRQGVQLK